MSFCGSREGLLSVKDGVLRNKCFVDVMNIIPHGLFVITSMTILIAWRQSTLDHSKVSKLSEPYSTFKMSFCGSREGSLSVKDGVLRNKCFVDVMNIIPHGLFVITCMTILIAWRQSTLGKLEARTWVQFKCHTLRWILTLFLILVNCLEIAEGFVSDYIDPDSANYHVIIPPCISVVASILSLVFYHNIEMWNSPRFLLILTPYWICSCGLKLLKAFSLYVSGVTSEHLRLWLTWLVVVLYTGLILVEIIVLFKQKYALFKKPVKIHPDPELANTRYYASFANFLSKATFWWMNTILIEGYKAPITTEQLGKLPSSEKAYTNYKKLLKAFEDEKEKAQHNQKKPSFHKAYLKAFWPLLVLAGSFRLLGDLLGFVGPWCIEKVIEYAYVVKESGKKLGNATVSNPGIIVYTPVDSLNSSINGSMENPTPSVEYYVTLESFYSNGYGLCIILFLATMLQHTFLHGHHYLVIREAVRFRSALQTMIYTKALRLSSINISSGATTVGQIMNHMSMDSTFLMMLFYFIHYVWATPLQVIITLTLMYFKLGISAVIGGLVIVLSAPLQVFVAKGMSKMQKKVMVQADQRVKQTNEMIQGMKVIKLLAWETYIGKGITDIRARELKFLFYNAIFRATFTFMGSGITVLATLMTFILYTHIQDQPLTAAKALSTLALFNILTVPLVLVTMTVTTFISAHVRGNELVLKMLREKKKMLTFILYTHIQDQPLTAAKALSTLALFNILTVPLVLVTMTVTTFISAHVSGNRLVPFFLAPEVEDLNSKNTDTIQTGTDLLGDADPEGVQLHLLSNKDKNDVLGASMCSLASHHSHAAHHVRQNSSTSLLDFTEHHHNPAAALTVSGDHHNQPHRRRRLSGFSTEDEDEPQHVLEINDGNFSWDYEKKDSTLKNINLQVKPGKLIMVVGPVGSGKSSLVSAILGEMITVSGRVHWASDNSIAYVPQKAWLLNKTLKDNILFGSHYMWKRYQKVIEACALQTDIDSLPAGDMSEIGEKGLNLSGGQKQRISIARALYSSADTYILDDPFSALDAHVGRHVFEEVILKKLLKRKKTVILVTHQLQYLSYANSVLVMEDGSIIYQGKLSEVKKIQPELYESWRKALKEAKTAEASSRTDSDSGADGTIDHIPISRQLSNMSQTSVEEAPTAAKETNGKPLQGVSHTDSEGTIDHIPISRQLSNMSQTSVEEAQTTAKETNGKPQQLSPLEEPPTEIPPTKDEATSPKDEFPEDKVKIVDPKTDKSATGKLIQKEHKEVGTINIRVYFTHLSACGWPLVVMVFLMLLIYQSLMVSTNVWISVWASHSNQFVRAKLPNSTDTFDNSRYINTYVVLSVSAVCATLISGMLLQFTGIRGAKNLHLNLLNTISKVPMRFFDTNPSGRIVNRFSSDMGQIDQKLPGTWDAFLRCAFATAAAIVVNCIGTPYFIIAVVPISVFYFCLQRFYTTSARELQRLDSVLKSPIFSHFSETLNGLTTIRAYRVQAKFRQQAVKHIDNYVVPFLYNQTANRWLGIRLDYMGAVLVFAASVSSLSSGLAGNIDPAFVGLCIAYALMVSNYLNWIVRNSSELELMMNAVERVDEYTKLETETTPSEEIIKESGWPSEGVIQFNKVSLSYDPSQDPVVSNVSFTIKAGEKVGICGRTGSGKSSLTLSLFRMVEISQGEILIDGKNISHIALPDLRSKIAIIPQDPILFTGTIRYNLDPGKEIADDKIWDALQSVQLKDTIEELPGKLEAQVSEGGENFSIGQKQLFCLARAFLRDNKILVLDEATASIDLETDNRLQQVIGTVFKDKTVITIAHRVSTIMKYDRVMAMEGGHIMEFDSPQTLMKNEDSYFAQLVKQSYK